MPGGRLWVSVSAPTAKRSSPPPGFFPGSGPVAFSNALRAGYYIVATVSGPRWTSPPNSALSRLVDAPALVTGLR